MNNSNLKEKVVTSSAMKAIPRKSQGEREGPMSLVKAIPEKSQEERADESGFRCVSSGRTLRHLSATLSRVQDGDTKLPRCFRSTGESR